MSKPPKAGVVRLDVQANQRKPSKRRGVKASGGESISIVERNQPVSRNSRNRAGRLTNSYIKALDNPFHFTPPRVGLGTCLPTSVSLAFNRYFVTLAANSYELIKWFPTTVAGQTTHINIANSNAANPWNTGTINRDTPVNSTNLNSRYQTGRCIAGGLRVRALNAATNAQPMFFVGNIFDTDSNILALSPNTTVTESQLLPMSNINNAVEALWRPADLFDYTFSTTPISTTAASNTASTVQPVIVCFNSAAANLTLLVESCYWIEGNSGVDQVGEDEVPSVAAEVDSVEQLMRQMVRRIGSDARDLLVDPVNTMASAFNNAMMNNRRFKLHSGLNREGGWIVEDRNVRSVIGG